MTTYLDEPFAKVWVDDTVPCIFCTILGPADKLQLETIAKIEMNCIKNLKKKHGAVFSLVDVQNCSILMEEAITQYFALTVHKQFSSGIKHKLFIGPKDKLLRASLLHLLPQYRDAKIEIFNSFDGALDAINMHKLYYKRNLKPRKSILGVLYSVLGNLGLRAQAKI